MRFTNKSSDQQVFKILLIVYVMAMLLVVFLADGTGDEGDSVMHYLFAKTASQYPQHFLDHWAKPLYVLIAFPFAQFGFIGIKIMNLMFGMGSFILVYQISEELAIKPSWLPSLFLASIPMFNFYMMSGLTENMFSFVLILGIYLLLKKKYVSGVVLLSFLPFIRSEGILILIVIAFFLTYRHKFYLIPFLLTGHVVYGIAGSFIYKSVWWVFTKMTYGTWTSAYGKGEWVHFFNKMPEIAGRPTAIVFYASLVFTLIQTVQFLSNKLQKQETDSLILFNGCMLIYFTAHTFFWALGIFNSGGILRVMVSIMPLIAIVNTRTIQYFLSFIFPENVRRNLYILIIAIIVIYPFTNFEFAYHWKRDFQLKADQYAEKDLKQWLEINYPNYKSYTLYYETCYLSELLNVDWFDIKQHKRLLDSFEKNEFKKGELIVWDDWFAVVEGHIELAKLETDSRFEKLHQFERINYWGVTRKTVLFKIK